METNVQLETTTAAMLRAKFGAELPSVQIFRSPIVGGLESKTVERITAHFRTQDGRLKRRRFVVKQLEGLAVREADVYREIGRKLRSQLAPDVLGMVRHSDHRVDLFLDHVESISPWPWRDLPASSSVIDRLAELHVSSREGSLDLPAWNYEDDLHMSAVATLIQLDRLRASADFSTFAKKERRSLVRLVSNLRTRRSGLLAFDQFGSTVLHGDVHPGNVIVRRRRGAAEPLLIDWGRARIGSALEDVSSWLHSLGYWEPEARRRHDTLLKRYLHDVGYEHGLKSEVREGLWMASASNALAGALRHYCVIAEHANTAEQRAAAAHSARNWLRVIVRADAVSH